MYELGRLKPLRRAVGLVWESARGWTVAGAVLMLLQGLLPLLALYLTKLTVDAVTAGIRSPDKEGALARVLLWIALTGFVALATAALRAVAEIVREQQGQRVTDHVMDVIHRQSAAVDLAYYEDPRYHDTLYRAQQEAPHRPTRMVQSLTIIVQNGVSLLGLAGLLLFLHWGVALVLFVAVLPGIAVKLRNARKLYAWQASRTKTERRAWDFHRMLTSASHAKELRIFGLGQVFRERYRELREKLREERMRLTLGRAGFDLVAQAAPSCRSSGCSPSWPGGRCSACSRWVTWSCTTRPSSGPRATCRRSWAAWRVSTRTASSCLLYTSPSPRD